MQLGLKKLFCCPPAPTPICLNSEEKSFYCTKDFFSSFFSFSKFKFILNMSKQLSTLLNWFKELMKWLISKIAPLNLIRPHLNGYNVV